MPTQPYFNAAGERVPGVTTVLGNIGWNKGALQHWAWREGSEGRDYRQTRDKAASIGTIAHALADRAIHGLPVPGDTYAEHPDLPKALVAYEAFKQWKLGCRLEVVATEFALVSERFQCGGTPDAVALGKVPGQKKRVLFLPDWKTASGTWADHLIQVGAYGAMWEDCYPWAPLTGGFAICRFDRDTGAFSHHWWPRDVLLPIAVRAFEAARTLHELRRPLEKMAR